MAMGDAFLLNPTVSIPKGTVTPWVPMDAVKAFTRTVTSDDERPFSGGSKFIDGDVLMARITPSLENGKTSIYRAAQGQGGVAAGSTEFIVVRGRDGVSDSRFAYYLLTSEKVRSFAISQMNGSSGRQRVQTDALAAHRVRVPNLDEQYAIVDRLSSLDDKIESNQSIVEAVPSLIRALVQEALAVRGSEIPVSDLANFVNGGAYTKGASGSGRMVLRIAELNSGPGGSTVYNDIEVPDEKTARAGDILMSWSGSLGVYRWFRDEAIINQHIFKVIPTNYPAWLVFDRLDAVMPVFQGIAKDKATTMGHIQRGHLDTTRFEIPEDDAIAELGAVVEPLWERLLLAERENVTLASLRDALLPQLLSGRVRVSGAATA